jgi:hypothetical protein
MTNPHNEVPSFTNTGFCNVRRSKNNLASRFRTSLCRSFSSDGGCAYGERCMFAHGPTELRTNQMNARDGIVTHHSVRQFRAETQTVQTRLNTELRNNGRERSAKRASVVPRPRPAADHPRTSFTFSSLSSSTETTTGTMRPVRDSSACERAADPSELVDCITPPLPQYSDPRACPPRNASASHPPLNNGRTGGTAAYVHDPYAARPRPLQSPSKLGGTQRDGASSAFLHM